tara:strand:+ start:421 stop:801 length:381 start_codon:yes stop_codon:yes gene_type:complete
MSESQRLKELLKQKELVESHLDWLNSEIAHAQGIPDLKPIPKAKSQKSDVPLPQNRITDLSQVPEELSSSEASPPKEQEHFIDEIYTELGPNTKSAANETKRGCLIAFSVAVLALGGLIALIYYIY